MATKRSHYLFMLFMCNVTVSDDNQILSQALVFSVTMKWHPFSAPPVRLFNLTDCNELKKFALT